MLANTSEDAMPGMSMGAAPMEGKREIDELRWWYRETTGADLSIAAGAAGGMGDVREITAGDEPDRAFLRMMIPHHARAITMADQVLLAGPEARVGSIARDIVAAQAAEIGEMQRWRARWFPPQG